MVSNMLEDKSILDRDFVDPFSRETWEVKTQGPGEEKVSDSWDRWAKSLVSVEKKEDRERLYNDFMSVLSKFNTLGGRIMSNIGINDKTASLFNCYVLQARVFNKYKDKGIDSMETIMECLTEQALTLKSEGGYGTNCSFMRPSGSYIHGVRALSPGPIDMLDMWDTQSDVITRGHSKTTDKRAKKAIRKGAQMVVGDVWHPNIEEFIEAKQTPGRLTKFNMSVGMYDAFMEAVAKDEDWELFFPDTEYENYDKEWDGDGMAWRAAGKPIKIYKTLKARKLYDKIMKCTYNRSEPGILFIDRINYYNNLRYCEKIMATNPCGEQPLPDGGICLLGALNLINYVNSDRSDFDYEAFAHDVAIHVRMLDNVNDIGKAPLEIQNWNIKNKRRIGQGIMGYGSALMLMNIRYGSKEALKKTEKLCKIWVNAAYKASALLAKEKEPFPLYDKKEFLKSNFLKILDPETIALIEKYGVRNSHILSIAPTGNTSIYANVSSGGLEPVFSAEYIRTVIIGIIPEGLVVPDKQDVIWDDTSKKYDAFIHRNDKGEATKSSIWKHHQEGDEHMLRFEYEGIIYKIDRNRGLTKEVPCIDWGVRMLKEEGKWDPKAEWAATATKLSPDDHINTMKVFAKYIDSALSKTINLPNKFSFSDFKDLYMDAWKSGYIKGITTYRAGTMGEVLKEEDQFGEEEEHIIRDNIKLPDDMPSRTKVVKRENIKWYMHVTYWNQPGPKKPFAVFVTTNHPVKKAMVNNAVQIFTDLAKEKGIRQKYIDETQEKCKTSSDVDKVTRMLSLNLRHGVSLTNIVAALEECGAGIGTLLHQLKKLIESHIPDGTKTGMVCPNCSKEVIYEGSCPRCSSCSWSKC